MSIGPRACLLAFAACLLLALASGCGAAPSPARKHAGPPPVVPGPSFAAPAGYRTGRSPNAIAIGDLSGDGRRDLVTANSASVSVLLNRGDGTFGARRDLPGGGDAVAIADLNGDGRRDVVVVGARGGFVDCRHCGAVSVLLNRGGGLLRPGRDYETGADPLAVVVGDLDVDGTPDLAVANGGGRLPNDVRDKWATGTVSILRGRGDGTFLARRDYAAGDWPMSLALADLNGDGKPDLATASGEGSSSVLLNRGDGAFRAGRGYDSTTGPTWVLAADLDGNGSRDLAVASNDWSDEVEESGVTLQPAHVYALANRGNGGFRRGRDLLQTFGYAEGIEALGAGDVNGDGKPDLAVTRYQPNYGAGFVSVLLNDQARRLPAATRLSRRSYRRHGGARARRPQRRRRGRPGHRGELDARGHRAPQPAGPVRRPGPDGGDRLGRLRVRGSEAAGRQADDRRLALPGGDDSARPFRRRLGQGPRDRTEARVRVRAAGRRGNRPRRQPRAGA